MVKTAANVRIYGPEDLSPLLHPREGESKLGEEMMFLASADPGALGANLHLAVLDGARYAVIGISEDIGRRANFGGGSTLGAWGEFLRSFLGFQANQYVDASRILMLGEFSLHDLVEQANSLALGMPTPVHKLRELCGQVDARIKPIIERVVEAGLEPVIIGGGSNNSYPILKGAVEALRSRNALSLEEGLTVLNCDAYAGFRILEGRHAGNAFTYSFAEDLLRGYFVLGLQEAYNGRDMLERMAAASFEFVSYEQLGVRGELTFAEALQRADHYAIVAGGPCAVELHLDAIENMPSALDNPLGISPTLANEFVYAMASRQDSLYLFLPDGLTAEGYGADPRVGKALANYALTYIKGREYYHRRHDESEAASPI